MIKSPVIILALILFTTPYSSADTVYFKKNSTPKYYQTYDDVGDGYIRIIVDGRSANYRKKSIYKIEKNDRVEDSYPPNEQALNQPQPIEKQQPKPPVIQQPKTTNNPIALIPPNKVKADIKKSLSEKYPGKYNAQKMLYDSYMDSYQFLSGLPDDKITTQILFGLLKYYPHMSAIKMLYESNMKSYRVLKSSD